VCAVARQFGWEFARNMVSLEMTGNAAPLGFSYACTYPGKGVEVWQLMPPQPLSDPNNSVPVDWVVGNTLVNSAQTKVIWSGGAFESVKRRVMAAVVRIHAQLRQLEKSLCTSEHAASVAVA
jgi:hypothetical protein